MLCCHIACTPFHDLVCALLRYGVNLKNMLGCVQIISTYYTKMDGESAEYCIGVNQSLLNHSLLVMYY